MRKVFARGDFRLLFCGLVASMIGESVLFLALAIWVKDITGSDGMAGATILALIAPMTLAPIVGWVVDRFRRRPFLVVANLISAATLVPLLAVRGPQDVWIIYLVAVAYGLSYIAISGSLQGLLKIIVPEDLLPDANGAMQTVKQGLRLFGPLAGAGLYVAIGGGAVAVTAMAGLTIAAGAIAVLRVRESKPVRGEARWVSEAMAGVRHLFGQPALRRAVLGLVLAVLVLGVEESLIFAYVDSGLHRPPAFVGILLTMQGVGGLAGGLLAARVVRRVGEVGSVGLGVAGFAFGTLFLAIPNLYLAFPALVVAGFGLPIAIVGFVTLMQRSTPSGLMGRTSAAADALISGPQAISIGAGAILVSFVDFRLLYVLVGVGLVPVAVYLWAGRSLSKPQTPETLESPAVSAEPTGDPSPVH